MFSRLGKDYDSWMPLAHTFPDDSSFFVQEWLDHGVHMLRVGHAFSKSDYKTIIVPVVRIYPLSLQNLADSVVL
jgi:hypothetical protein